MDVDGEKSAAAIAMAAPTTGFFMITPLVDASGLVEDRPSLQELSMESTR